tara:strand:- start:139 stop:486 length:348 start_codon:yes stop_codon:yes gene_type:complete
MENLTFDQLPKAVTMLTNEVSELKRLLLEKREKQLTEQSETFLNIQEAAKFLNLTVPTMYSKVSKREISFCKRGKRLYFSSIELMDYIKEGRKKSNAEIEAEAENYLKNKGGKDV